MLTRACQICKMQIGLYKYTKYKKAYSIDLLSVNYIWSNYTLYSYFMIINAVLVHRVLTILTMPVSLHQSIYNDYSQFADRVRETTAGKMSSRAKSVDKDAGVAWSRACREWNTNFPVADLGGGAGVRPHPPWRPSEKIQGLLISKIVRTADSTIIIIITNFYLAASFHEIFLRVGGREGMKGLGALQRHQLPHPPCKNPESATGVTYFNV